MVASRALAMDENPDNLRLYASIMLKPRRYERGGALYHPSEIEKACADSLLFKAAAIEQKIVILGYEI